MARIKTYTTDDNVTEYDIVIGSDANNLDGTKNYTMGALRRYALAGISPVNGGLLGIREITYTGGLYSTPYAYLNSLDPAITIQQYDVVVVNVNSVKHLLNKQSITVGVGHTPLVSSDFILIKDAPQTFNQVNSDWNATSGVSQIQNKPTIPAAQVQSNWTATSGLGVILNKPVVDGSETKVTAGTSITITGSGTTAAPYVVNSTSPVANGSETKINPGTSISVTGNGTIAVPYVINSTVNGSETKVTSGSGVSITGNGTIATPYVVNSTALSPFINKGWIEVGDIPRPMSTVLVCHGDAANALVTGTWGGGNEITVTFANAFPDTNYSVDLQCEYLGTDYAGSVSVYPISWKRVNQNSFKFLIAEISNTQNFNFHFKTISY